MHGILFSMSRSLALRVPVLFIINFLIVDQMAEEFHPSKYLLSHLALSEFGPYISGSMVFTGIVLFAGAGCMISTTLSGVITIFDKCILLLIGVGLFFAGIFPIDPGMGYPPGANSSSTLYGILHQVAGFIFFTSLIIASFRLSVRLKKQREYFNVSRYSLLAGWITLLSWILASTSVALSYVKPELPIVSGFFERVAIIAGIGWFVYSISQLTTPQIPKKKLY